MKTYDFYLYGNLDKITSILNILEIPYTVETTTNYVINFKRLSVPDNNKIANLLGQICELLGN